MTQTELTPTIALTGKWQPYPAYKDSGVEWLGEIPAHWDLAPLYSRYSIQLGKMRNQEDITGLALAPYLRNVNIQWDHVDISDIFEMDFAPAERRKYALTNGDLLVCEGGEVGRTAIWRGELAECYIQNAVHRVRPLTYKELGRFLFYVLYAVAKLGVFEAGVNRSTIGHLTSEKLKKYRFMFPPFTEQRAIAAFLDHEIARINALITKKEQLIELLKEKRATLISHAVTKGLDPTVPMKDSGVEWLGEIPEHWEVKRVRDITELLQTGPFGSQLHSSDYSPNGIPVINPSHLKDGHISPDWDCAVNEETFSRLTRHGLQKGDIVFARRGQMGRCALVTEKEAGWLCGTGSLLMRPRVTSSVPSFLSKVLSTDGVRDWLLLESVGSTMDNLNTSILSRIPLPMPTL